MNRASLLILVLKSCVRFACFWKRFWRDGTAPHLADIELILQKDLPSVPAVRPVQFLGVEKIGLAIPAVGVDQVLVWHVGRRVGRVVSASAINVILLVLALEVVVFDFLQGGFSLETGRDLRQGRDLWEVALLARVLSL